MSTAYDFTYMYRETITTTGSADTCPLTQTQLKEKKEEKVKKKKSTCDENS